MKSPAEMATRLARQWQQASARVERLLSGDSWPLELAIGKPTAATFANQTARVQRHVQSWKEVALGEVVWENVNYRAAATPIPIPICWRLRSPSEWVAAAADADVQREYACLERLINQVDSCYREVLVRERSLWHNKDVDEVVMAADVADSLEPGAAKGQPLRLLNVGVDTKFFERNEVLLTRLLDVRHDGVASEKGLGAFLDAPDDKDHWLLVVPLAPDLLPFQRQRVRATELVETRLPGNRLLVVENEQCMHLLPDLPGTVAVLGAGLDLRWLGGAASQSKQVAYWGDMDTWGLVMLARARQYCPALSPLLMTRSCFEMFSAQSAVFEPVPAALPSAGLSKEEMDFFAFLLAQEKGRLEQEYLLADVVRDVLFGWLKGDA